MGHHTIRADRKTAPAATIYITQPVLPIIREEFGISLVLCFLLVPFAAGLLEARTGRGR